MATGRDDTPIHPVTAFTCRLLTRFLNEKVYVVNAHTRDHFYGRNSPRSHVDDDIDPMKLTVSAVTEPKIAEFYQTESGTPSVAYETEFDHSIGRVNAQGQRGRIFYVHITENSDQSISAKYDYVAITTLVCRHGRIQNGPNAKEYEQKPLPRVQIIRT